MNRFRLLLRALVMRLRSSGPAARNQHYDEQTVAVMERALDSNSNCIDVGAHMGTVLTEMLRVAPAGRHVAFEPLPSCYDHLVRTFGSCSNVTIFELALSERAGESPFQHVWTNSGYSGFRRRRYVRPDEGITTIQVKTERLDALIPLGARVDFIKIDVEGAELGVLRGGVDTIRRNRPIIVFEHGLGAADYYGTTPEAVYDLLERECGLRVSLMERWLTDQEPLSRREFLDQFYTGVNFYFIAHA